MANRLKLITIEQAIVFACACILIAFVSDIGLLVMYIRHALQTSQWLQWPSTPTRTLLTVLGVVPYLIAMAGFWAIKDSNDDELDC